MGRQKRVRQRVKALRQQHGISRAELALLLGVSRMRVSPLEKQGHITEKLDKRIRRARPFATLTSRPPSVP